MRWDNLLQEASEDGTAKLPLFAEEALIRRFNTPEFRGMTFYEVRARSIINHVKPNNMGFSWTINPYRGCSHACVYCFARPTHTYLDMDAGQDFESKIVVKTNAVELLRRELRRPAWKSEHIAMGTNTDNYQRAEGRYRLMRGILSELNAVRNPYSILTKSTLIQRDLDLLLGGAAVSDVSVSFSIGTVDEQVWNRTEPGTPHPRKRLELVRRFNEAGIPTGVLMAPILPGISDSPEQLQATVRAIADARPTHLTPIVLHLRKGVKEEFMPWLEKAYPELVRSYREIYEGSNAGTPVAEPIYDSVRELKRRFGARSAGGRRSDAPREPAPPEQQLAFDLGAGSPRQRPHRRRRS